MPCGSGREPESTQQTMNDKTLSKKAAPIRSHQRADVTCQSLNAKKTQSRAPPHFRRKATQANGNSSGDRMIGSFIVHRRTPTLTRAAPLASDMQTERRRGVECSAIVRLENTHQKSGRILLATRNSLRPLII